MGNIFIILATYDFFLNIISYFFGIVLLVFFMKFIFIRFRYAC